MKRFNLLAALLTLSLCLTSCLSITKSKAKGAIEERTFPLTEEVIALALSNGVDVTVDSTLPSNEIRVRTHTDIFDILELQIEDSTLEIGLKSSSLYAEVFEVRIPELSITTIAMSGGCDLEWDSCQATDLTIAISGGADCEIKGSCETLSVAISGGADADLDELVAQSVTVAASGGADVEVHATRALTIQASGGADVTYKGNPEIKDIHTSGGADVYHE